MLAYFFIKPLQSSNLKLFRTVILRLDDVARLWEDSNIHDKVSSTSKEYVEDMLNNVYVDDRHTFRHDDNVVGGQTDMHADAHTWYELVSSGTIRGRNVQL